MPKKFYFFNCQKKGLLRCRIYGWKHLEFGIFDGLVLLQRRLNLLSFFLSWGNGLDFPLDH
jgi:hypothetical protein